MLNSNNCRHIKTKHISTLFIDLDKVSSSRDILNIACHSREIYGNIAILKTHIGLTKRYSRVSNERKER